MERDKLFNEPLVELLAPAGNFESLKAAVSAGADAVYLGGKHFNMRMHEGDFNFSDEDLKKAVDYAHSHSVKVYVTVNNLISAEETGELRAYLKYLGEIAVDAILAQDMAVVAIHNELNLKVPLHASVMMNTHNEEAALWLKRHGVTRIVAGRETSLAEVSLLKEHTGLEFEYFIHGDMCIAESGQCVHSGVLFGQSSSRGRCMKPCRWPFKLIDEETGEVLDKESGGAYKLALKDMCMIRNLRELIKAGVYSFKIEGRMRSPEFVSRLVSTYRKAIDAYLKDPAGSQKEIEESWKSLYENRVRDYTTAFALQKTTKEDIGFTGEREPRFFSRAIKEAEFNDEILKSERNASVKNPAKPLLSVRVANIDGVTEAVNNGTDAVYVGGEAFLPLLPWSIADYENARKLTKEKGVKLVIATSKSTNRYELAEIKDFFKRITEISPDAIMVGNLGTLKLAEEMTDIPVYGDVSFNLFNPITANFWQKEKVAMMTTSLELSYAQLREIAENSTLPLEVIVHGATTTMLTDHNIAAMSLPSYNPLENPEIMNRHYALLDEAGEKHMLRYDQYGRTHIYFANDLCLYPYLEKFNFAKSLRIEGQNYDAKLVGFLTKVYRERIDAIASGNNDFLEDALNLIKEKSSRSLGVGIYKYRESRNSV